MDRALSDLHLLFKDHHFYLSSVRLMVGYIYLESLLQCFEDSVKSNLRFHVLSVIYYLMVTGV